MYMFLASEVSRIVVDCIKGDVAHSVDFDAEPFVGPNTVGSLMQPGSAEIAAVLFVRHMIVRHIQSLMEHDLNCIWQVSKAEVPAVKSVLFLHLYMLSSRRTVLQGYIV